MFYYTKKFINYLWYGWLFIILKDLNICSDSIKVAILWANVRLLREITLSQRDKNSFSKPKAPPMKKFTSFLSSKSLEKAKLSTL